MPTTADEFEPPPDLMDVFVDQCLAPLIKRLEVELGRPLAGGMEAWIGDRPAGLRRDVRADAADALKFDGRVRFRRTSDPGRVLFMGQVRIFGAEHGFTGFKIRGHVKAGAPEVKSHTGLYNQTEWLEW